MSGPIKARSQKAQRRYRCDGIAPDCVRLIDAGTRYWRSVLPPRTDPNSSDGWWSHRLCLPCALYYDHVSDDEKMALAAQEASAL